MADMKRLEAFLAEVRVLRAAQVEAEVEFFRKLAEGEEDESLWKGDPGERTGYLTFAELLNAENICRPHRLTAYKDAVAAIGFSRVREIGIDNAKVIAAIPADAPSLKIKGQTAREGILQDTHTSRIRNNTTPSRQQVRSIKRQHYAPPPAPPVLVVSDAERIRELERKNAKLEKALARVTKERDAALAKLAKIKVGKAA